MRSRHLGDDLFVGSVAVALALWALAWIVAIALSVVRYLIPSSRNALERGVGFAYGIGMKIFKYAVVLAVGLFLLRMIAGFLGWAPEIAPSTEPPEPPP